MNSIADLEKTNNVELMRGDAEMATALQDQFSHIPFPTPFADVWLVEIK